MTPEQERLLSQAADAKLVHLNEQLIFPMLQNNIEARIASLCETFKSAGTVQMSDVAYVAACRDIMLHLTAKARRGDSASRKLNLNPDIE